MAWMLKTVCLVDACYKSPSPRARAARKIGGKSILEWVVRRTTDAQQVEGVVVVTTDDPENQFLDRLVPPDVPILRAPTGDPLRALLVAAERLSAEAAVRVRPLFPFLDSALLDHLIIAAQSLENPDYVTFCHRDGRPVLFSPLGLFAEWFRCDALRRAARRFRGKQCFHEPTECILSRPHEFRVQMIPVPEEIDREDMRLVIGDEEDWDTTETIYEALGPERLDWHAIVRLVNQCPQLRQRMAALNQAQAAR